jgi:hypothetical protein
MLRLALIVLVLLAIPAPALAAEGFVGVLENGRLVRFSVQRPGYSLTLSRPIAPRGMLPGERIVALGGGANTLFAVGSSARLYRIGATTGRARPVGPPFPEGLRGSRFSLAVSQPRARLISDVGQDLAIDLVTGATEPGPGLRRADDGAPLRPAVDTAADGRLVGAQLSPWTLLRETAPGASTMSAIPLERFEHDPALGEPISFQIGSDGRGYLLAVLSDRNRQRQSTLLTIDPVSGKRNRVFPTFSRRLTTIASVGPVPDDKTPPQVRIALHRMVSARQLFAGRPPLTVRCSESCQVTLTLRVGGRRIGFGFGTRDTPGTVRFTDRSRANFSVSTRDRAWVRRHVGRRIRLVMGVNDLKGNRRQVIRTARLVR